jgi:MFS family permease
MTPNPDACPTPVPAPGRPAAVPGAWAALVLLVCMNLFNYIDRQVLAAVEPEVRRVLLAPDDPNQKTKMGLLSTAFLVSYMLIAPLFGWLAERYPRWKLIAVGVLLWSLATGASGLAITFAMMLLTRCFVGIGEGAYGPVAPTLLSDFYPVSVRGRVLAVFYAAIPVGGALGYALGGQMAAWSPERESCDGGSIGWSCPGWSWPSGRS